MEKRIFEELDYILRMPAKFSNQEKYPLVIYLHGAGGRGRDTDIIYNHPFFTKTEPWLKGAISVAPQCYEDSINSHLLVYAAEESRKTGRVVNL